MSASIMEMGSLWATTKTSTLPKWVDSQGEVVSS